MHFDTFSDLKRWFDTAFVKTTDDQMTSLLDILGVFRDREQLSMLLELILNEPTAIEEIAARSYTHVNAFDKIVLLSSAQPQYKLRLHIWWPMPEDVAQKKEGFRVHNHRWNFSSIILCGAMRVQHFDVLPVDQTGIKMHEYKYIAADDKDHYTMQFIGPAKLNCSFDGVVTAGNYYALSHTVQHRIITERAHTAATLVLRGGITKPLVDVFADQPIEGYERVEVVQLSPNELLGKLKDLQSVLYERQ
jgi:hypothetical protein